MVSRKKVKTENRKGNEINFVPAYSYSICHLHLVLLLSRQASSRCRSFHCMHLCQVKMRVDGVDARGGIARSAVSVPLA